MMKNSLLQHHNYINKVLKIVFLVSSITFLIIIPLKEQQKAYTNSNIVTVGVKKNTSGIYKYNGEYTGYIFQVLNTWSKEHNKILILKEYTNREELSLDLTNGNIYMAVTFSPNDTVDKIDLEYSEPYSIALTTKVNKDIDNNTIIKMMLNKSIYVTKGAVLTEFYKDMEINLDNKFSVATKDSHKIDFYLDRSVLIDIERFNNKRIKTVIDLDESVTSYVVSTNYLNFSLWYDTFKQSAIGTKLKSDHNRKKIFYNYTKAGYLQAMNYSSVYDALFKEIGKKENIDWKILSSIAHVETRFNNEATSHKNAIGLMQVMPITAKHFGYAKKELYNPYINILIATKLLHENRERLNLNDKSINIQDRLAITLCSYNCGIGHTEDAYRLTEAHDKNPKSWEDLSFYLEKLRYKDYCKDKNIVRYGTFNAKETINYVEKVLHAYNTIYQNK